MNEFDLIRTYFASHGISRDDVLVPIGDDAAVVRVPAGMVQAITTDVLVAGTHFLVDAEPASVGHKSLAVNLSDLAAMGARPAWFTLGLSLPEADSDWLEGFCRGMFALARVYNAQLIGGDTVRGPLSVAIQAHGLLPEGTPLRRCGACAGDRIYVTGTLGEAALALLHLQGGLALTAEERAQVLARLNYPQPRVRVGEALRTVASSCIDISDGLLADLGHILEASAVGARIWLERLPVSAVYRAHAAEAGGFELALAGGDDYELCFTVAAANEPALERRKRDFDCELTCIGEVQTAPGLRLIGTDGQLYSPRRRGYDHFGEPSAQPVSRRPPPTKGRG